LKYNSKGGERDCRLRQESAKSEFRTSSFLRTTTKHPTKPPGQVRPAQRRPSHSGGTGSCVVTFLTMRAPARRVLDAPKVARPRANNSRAFAPGAPRWKFRMLRHSSRTCFFCNIILVAKKAPPNEVADSPVSPVERNDPGPLAAPRPLVLGATGDAEEAPWRYWAQTARVEYRSSSREHAQSDGLPGTRVLPDGQPSRWGNVVFKKADSTDSRLKESAWRALATSALAVGFGWPMKAAFRSTASAPHRSPAPALRPCLGRHPSLDSSLSLIP
jgi:hypothetical protein